MRNKKVRWISITTALLGLTATVLWMAPLGSAQGGGTTQKPSGVTCQLALPPLQPEEPLEMNTVLQGDLFKTVAMEKEVYTCSNAQGQLVQIHDVETFIEIIERNRLDFAQLIEKRVEIATCVKDLQSGQVSCKAEDRPLTPNPQPPLLGCSPHQENPPPKDPVEMNTVAPKRGVVKTIKMEKEIFDCGPEIRDLYVFTEIIEVRTVIPGTQIPTLRPVAKTFETIYCNKRRDAPVITACFRFGS